MKFLHTADCHLDALLKGLEQYEGCPADRVRRSTRDAFSNVVTIAIEESVDFVVIAGDLFDGQWTNQQTALWCAGQFRRLHQAGIQVFLIRGNHDALAANRQSILWPDNVHEFPVDRAATIRIDRLGVAIHGRGFADQKTTTDLAADYPDAEPGLFNIGILHTSLAGDPRHDTYAPTTERVLEQKGYDYWALGHIHTCRQVRDRPRIVYSGCTQGRHINETGAKGCIICTVGGRGEIAEAYHETDVLRWATIEIDLQGVEDFLEVSNLTRDRLDALVREHAPRLVGVRLKLTGATPLHAELMTPTGQAEAVRNIRMIASLLDDVWIEQVEFTTLPPLDLAKLHAEHGLLAELLGDVSAWREKPDADLSALSQHLEPLVKKAGTELNEAGIDINDPAMLRRWLQQAESLLLVGLTEEMNDEAVGLGQ